MKSVSDFLGPAPKKQTVSEFLGPAPTLDTKPKETESPWTKNSIAAQFYTGAISQGDTKPDITPEQMINTRTHEEPGPTGTSSGVELDRVKPKLEEVSKDLSGQQAYFESAPAALDISLDDLERDTADIKGLKTQLENTKVDTTSKESVDEYNKLINDFNARLPELQSKVKAYNESIKQYQSKRSEYESRFEEYDKLQKDLSEVEGTGKEILRNTAKQLFDFPRSFGEVGLTTMQGIPAWFLGHATKIGALAAGADEDRANELRDSWQRAVWQPETPAARQFMEWVGEGTGFISEVVQDAAECVGESWDSKTLEAVAQFAGELATFHFLFRGAQKGVSKVPTYESVVKEVVHKSGMPKEVWISPKELREFHGKGDPNVISPEVADMIKDLGLTGKDYRAALKEGIDVKVETSKIISHVDKPWFAKLKNIFKVKPYEKIIKTEGKTTWKPSKSVSDFLGKKEAVRETVEPRLLEGPEPTIKGADESIKGPKPPDEKPLTATDVLEDTKANLPWESIYDARGLFVIETRLRANLTDEQTQELFLREEYTDKAMPMIDSAFERGATKEQVTNLAHRFADEVVSKIYPTDRSINKPSVIEEPTSAKRPEEVKAAPEVNEREIEYAKVRPELLKVFDFMDDFVPSQNVGRLRRAKKFSVSEINLKPGEPADVPATWHDGAFRYTILKSPDGTLEQGASGSYDTVMMPGHAARSGKGTLPPGYTAYFIDLGPYNLRNIRIYRSSPEPVGAQPSIEQAEPKAPTTTATTKKSPEVSEPKTPTPSTAPKEPKAPKETKFKKLTKDEHHELRRAGYPEKEIRQMSIEEQHEKLNMSRGAGIKHRPIPTKPDVGIPSNIRSSVFRSPDPINNEIKAQMFSERMEAVARDPDLMLGKLINDVNRYIDGIDVPIGEVISALKEADKRSGELKLAFDNPKDFNIWRTSVKDVLNWANEVGKKPGGFRLNMMIPVDQLPAMVKKVLISLTASSSTLFRNKEVWKKTGFWLGRDMKWRYELNIDSIQINQNRMQLMPNLLRVNLTSLLRSEELYRAVPQLRDIEVEVDLRRKRGGTSWIDKKVIEIADPNVDPGAIDTLIHEVQHFTNYFMESPFTGTTRIYEQAAALIDFKTGIESFIKDDPHIDLLLSELLDNLEEGDAWRGKAEEIVEWAKTEDILTPSQATNLEKIIAESAAERYLKSPGEMEARLAEERFNLTPEQRRNTPPWETLDEMLKDEHYVLSQSYNEEAGINLYGGLPLAELKRIAKRIHPAPFPKVIQQTLAKVANGLGITEALDIFAGVGRIGLMKDYGFKGKIIANEIEPKWATYHTDNKVDKSHVGDARDLPYADGSIESIITSPTYGNRIGLKSPSKLDTYTAMAGGQLQEGNTGAEVWGPKYEQLHREAYIEAARVVKPGGYFILNMKDMPVTAKDEKNQWIPKRGSTVEVSDGQMKATDWHIKELEDVGFTLVDRIRIDEPTRVTSTQKLSSSVGYEEVVIMAKPDNQVSPGTNLYFGPFGFMQKFFDNMEAKKASKKAEQQMPKAPLKSTGKPIDNSKIKPTEVPPSTVIQRKQAHVVAGEKGLLKGNFPTDTYRKIAENVTGKKSVKDMNLTEAKEFIKVLRSLPDAKSKPLKVPKGENIAIREWGVPSLLKYVYPSNRYAILLNCYDLIEPSIHAKTALDNHRVRVFNRLDQLKKMLNKETSIAEQSLVRLRNKPTRAEVKMWEALDKYRTSSEAGLTGIKKDVFNELRSLTDDMLTRVNEVRELVGLEPINKLDTYVRYMFDSLTYKGLRTKYPIGDIPDWADATTSKHIFNPTAIERLASHPEPLKDPIRALKAMVSADLKQIYLERPNILFTEQMKELKPGMPVETYEWLMDFMNQVIKNRPTKLDMQVNRLLKEGHIEGAIDLMLRPFGRALGQNPVKEITAVMSRLIHDAVIWGKVRLVLRNHTQKLLTLGMYPTKHFARAMLPMDNKLRKLIKEGKWESDDPKAIEYAKALYEWRTHSGQRFFEQLPEGMFGKMETVGFKPYGWSHISNVDFTLKVIYYSGMELAHNPKYKRLGWTEADTFKEMLHGTMATQFWYNLMGLPQLYRSGSLRIFATLQSWWMNYFAYCGELGSRAFRGKTSWGKPIPFSWRVGAFRHLIASAIFVEALKEGLGISYDSIFGLGVVPSTLSPPAQLLLGMIYLLTGIAAGEEWKRKEGIRRIKNAYQAFVPASGAYGDLEKIVEGNYKEIFFYTDKDYTDDFKGFGDYDTDFDAMFK